MNRRVQGTGGLRKENGFLQKKRGSHREPRLRLSKNSKFPAMGGKGVCGKTRKVVPHDSNQKFSELF